MLCKYSDILGKPNEGLHAYRLGPFAIVDVIMTLVLAFIINFMISGVWQDLLKIFAILWIVAEILHGLFCINTTFWRYVK